MKRPDFIKQLRETIIEKGAIIEKMMKNDPNLSRQDAILDFYLIPEDELLDKTFTWLGKTKLDNLIEISTSYDDFCEKVDVEPYYTKIGKDFYSGYDFKKHFDFQLDCQLLNDTGALQQPDIMNAITKALCKFFIDQNKLKSKMIEHTGWVQLWDDKFEVDGHITFKVTDTNFVEILQIGIYDNLV